MVISIDEELVKAQALVMVQQREIYQLQQQIIYYKNERKKSHKHYMKIKNNTLVIKIGDQKWILSKDSVKCGDQIIVGQWKILTKGYLRMIGHQTKGGVMFQYAFHGYNGDIREIELYFQPLDTHKHGNTYKYHASKLERKALF